MVQAGASIEDDQAVLGVGAGFMGGAGGRSVGRRVCAPLTGTIIIIIESI